MMKRRLLLLGLLLLSFARLADMALALSATVDEGFHITSGNEYLHTGHLHLLDEHTPLVKAWMALPLLPLDDLTPPQAAPGYAEGDLIRVARATTLAYRPLDRVIVPPRLMVALLTVLLLASVFRWAATHFGPTGGAVALMLAAFDPNLLAHGALATTDLGATLFIFWALWAFERYLAEPTRGHWWRAALLLGLAQLAKLTALLLLPVVLLLMLAAVPRRRWWSAFLRRYLPMVGVAALVVWGGYGFEVRPVAGLPFRFALPAAGHIERIVRLRENLAYGREAFLLGANGMHGWTLYFPLAFLLKTPTATLALLFLTLVLLRRYRRGWRVELALWLFPLLYGLSALRSTIDIGYRHLLPLLPLLDVAMGRLALWMREARPRRWLVAAALGWLALEGGWLHPHELAYFNLIAGGPGEGWRFLADSNTDWGQALKVLAAQQRAGRWGKVRLSQFIFYDPAAYGVRYRPIAPMEGAPPILPRRFDPEPGLYAISATTLDGVPLPYPPTYDWFRHREPLAKLGYALFLYRVEPSGGRWLAQCTDPVPPLPESAVVEGFGRDDLRLLRFDCTQTWVVPAGRGWYARAIPPEEGLHWPRRDARLDRLAPWAEVLRASPPRLSYLQPRPGELPAFALWWWGDGVPPAPPIALQEGITFGGTATLLGCALPRKAAAGETVELLTWWRVERRPPRPLSLMLHLRTADGATIAVGDALGFSAEQWQAGDLVIQRHRLTIPAGVAATRCTPWAGVYTLDDVTPLASPQGEAVALPTFPCGGEP